MSHVLCVVAPMLKRGSESGERAVLWRRLFHLHRTPAVACLVPEPSLAPALLGTAPWASPLRLLLAERVLDALLCGIEMTAARVVPHSRHAGATDASARFALICCRDCAAVDVRLLWRATWDRVSKVVVPLPRGICPSLDARSSSECLPVLLRCISLKWRSSWTAAASVLGFRSIWWLGW